MGLMYAYGAWVIKVVPKSTANSKAGLFAQMVDQLIASHEAPLNSDGKAFDFDAFNQQVKHSLPFGAFTLKESPIWKEAAQLPVGSRTLLLARANLDGEIWTIGLFPLAKRHFPKTSGFSYRDGWFFTYGVENSQAQIGIHQLEVEALRRKGLNLVVMNYGNDFYLLSLSRALAREQAIRLFDKTTIFPSPEP